MSTVLRPAAGRSLLLAAAAVLAAFSAGAGAADADAAGNRSDSDAVRIATPVTDGLVTTGQVRVELETAPDVTRVHAYAGPKDVSSHFARRGGVWTGTLPRSLFKAGANRLLVHAYAGKRSAGTDAHSFILSRDAAVQTTVRSDSAAQARMSAGPAATKSYAPTPGTLPVSVHSATPSVAQLTVNGHAVADLRATRFLNDHSYLVSSVDGLRPGVNRLVLSTYDRSGRHAVKRWTIDRSAALPLAEAGARERVTHKGEWTQLDATASRPTATGASLRYRWRVVSAPAGAKPVLQGAATAKPSFKPDVPGVYQVALSATHVNAGGAAAAAAVGTSSEDVATIDVAPTIGDQGLYVGTDLEQRPDFVGYSTMFIDGQPYTSTIATGIDVFVQFDETTLTPLRSGTDATITPAAGTVTVGVWDDVDVSNSSNPHGSAVWIGTAQVADNETPNAQAGIGNPSSNLHGWLQAAPANKQASWVGSDMLQVQTQAKGSTTTSNVMSINGSTYSNSLPSGGVGGYQMLLLDNTGAPLDGAGTVYSTDGTDAGNAAMAAALATDLDNAVDTGRLTVLLQGFGSLPAIADESALSNALVSAGARADVVDRFNGKTDSAGGVYALVSGMHAGGGANTQTRETSFERRGSGSLSALLVRAASDVYDDYIPFNSDNGPVDSVASNRYQPMPMLYAAPTTWDNWVRVNQTGPLRAPTVGETAALKSIVDYATAPGQNWVDIKKPCAGAPDAIRGYYCDTTSSDLGTLYDEEGRMMFNAADGQANGYTQTDFTTVQNTLMWEALNAEGVRSSIATYQSMFGAGTIVAAVNADSIAGQIKLTRDAGMSNSINMLNVWSAVTDMASVIPGIGPLMTFTSGTFSLASDLLPNSSTGPDISTQIEISKDNAADELTAEYQAASLAMNSYGDYIVEDPAKLLEFGDLFKGAMAMSSTDVTNYQWAGEFAAKQFLWGAILAGSYAEWAAPPSAKFSTNPKCSRDSGSWLHPFENMDASGRWTGFKPGDSTNTMWWIAANAPTSAPNTMINNNTGLPSATTDNLFAPVDPTTPPMTQDTIGAVMPYFALDYLPFQTVPEWNPATDTNGCEAGT